MKTRHKKLFGLGSLILLTASFATAQSTLSQSFNGIEEIEISVASGDAVFKNGPESEVSFELVHTFAEDYDPVISQRGSKLIIKERENRNSSYQGRATWTFKVPDDIEVEFNTGSGDGEMSGISCEARLNSGSGDFRLEKMSGKFKIKSGSGDIEASDSKGELDLSTGSGDIELESIVADIDVSTGSGDIEAAEIELTGHGRFSTGSGSSEVSFAATPQFDVAVSSGSGNATLDFDGNAIEGLLTAKASKRRGKIEAPFEFDTTEEIDNGNNTVIKKTKKFGTTDIQLRVSSGSGTVRVVE